MSALALIFLITLLTLFGLNANAQLGIFEFTGTQNAGCPTGTVTTQPANASFGTGNAFTSANVICASGGAADTYRTSGWNTTGTIDLTEYHQFTITPNTGYTLTLTSFSFFNQNTNTMNWFVRSSVDNFNTNIGSGTSSATAATPSFALPGSYINLGATTFRIYITGADNATDVLRIDNVSLSGSVVCTPPAAPAVSSPVTYCQNVTAIPLTATGSGLLWYTGPVGGTGASTAPTPLTTTTGTVPYYVSQTIGCEGSRAQINVIVNALPVASVTGQSNITCFAANDGTITVSGSGGTSPYTFSINNGVNYLPPTSGNTRFFTGLAPNSPYKIRVKDNAACESKPVQ